MSRDPRVDAYIARSPEFAKPILTYFRETVHAAVPDVEETIKWGAPAFVRKGILTIMASFKEKCGMNFWKGRLIGNEGYGDIRSVDDLPPKKELTAIIRKLAHLNDEGVKIEKKGAPKKEARTPSDLAAALKKNKKAASAYDNFSPSNRREYIQWITEAKTDETRRRRVDQAIIWIAEGKSRNWKYMKK